MGSAASTLVAGDGGAQTVATVLICHSLQERRVRELLEFVLPNEESNDVVVVTEQFPRDLQTRAELLTACQRAVIGVDPKFQTSTTLIETLSFLKDNRKEVVAGPLTFFTRPSGAVGAICTAFGKWDARLFEDSAPLNAQLLSSSTKLLRLSELREVCARSRTPEEFEQTEQADQCQFDEATGTASEAGCESHLFFVFADDDGRRIAAQFDGMEVQGTRIAGSSSVSTGEIDRDIGTLAKSRVVAFIITATCVTSATYRRLFEAALRWKKPILPINAGVRLSGWLQMVMAGRLWYQVDLDHLEYIRLPYSQVPNCPCKVSDSCLATDFLMCANGMLTATTQPGVLEASLVASREQAVLTACRDQALVHGLDANALSQLMTQVHEVVDAIESGGKPVTELEQWGVATTTEAIEDQRGQAAVPFPSAGELLPEKPELELHHQHYNVTRMSFEPPPSVLDANGLPIPNLQLDAMFSYQWGSQNVLLDVNQQGHLFNVRAWFDVFGHMQGNVNSAMAAAVENVACVVVFLTQKYVESINCQLEFQYAAKCRKPFILVLLSDISELTLPTWMTEVVGMDFSVYPSRVNADTSQDRVLALDYRADRVNGVPLTNVLFGAIRELAARRNRAPPSITYDASLLLYATTSALRHAIVSGSSPTEAAATSAAASLAAITCTRCGVAFHPSVASSLQGCRTHSAYYMGGSLMAGRWVCCQETKTDGPGCQPADHIQGPRTWSCDPSYGTHMWVPQ